MHTREPMTTAGRHAGAALRTRNGRLGLSAFLENECYIFYSDMRIYDEG